MSSTVSEWPLSGEQRHPYYHRPSHMAGIPGRQAMRSSSPRTRRSRCSNAGGWRGQCQGPRAQSKRAPCICRKSTKADAINTRTSNNAYTHTHTHTIPAVLEKRQPRPVRDPGGFSCIAIESSKCSPRRDGALSVNRPHSPRHEHAELLTARLPTAVCGAIQLARAVGYETDFRCVFGKKTTSLAAGVPTYYYYGLDPMSKACSVHL